VGNPHHDGNIIISMVIEVTTVLVIVKDYVLTVIQFKLTKDNECKLEKEFITKILDQT